MSIGSNGNSSGAQAARDSKNDQIRGHWRHMSFRSDYELSGSFLSFLTPFSIIPIFTMETKASSIYNEKNDASSPNDSDSSPTRIENGKVEGLFLSEEEALVKAREDLDSTRPIYVAFGKDDVSNPRNFADWKKWYVGL